VSSSVTEANGASLNPAISEKGRFIAFDSDATDLEPGDTNDQRDVFIHDGKTLITRRISADVLGLAADGPSSNASVRISNARFVAFESTAADLVPNDANGVSDVFVRDTKGFGDNIRASVNSQGTEADGPSFHPTLAATADLVAFESDATNLIANDTQGFRDIFIYNINKKETVLASISTLSIEADGPSFLPSFAASGRGVAFESDATNMVASDTNGFRDIFFHYVANVTVRVSLATGGGETNGPSFHPSVSASGRFIAFESDAANLVANDANGVRDIFVHDVQTGTTTRVSLATGGGEANGSSFHPSISANGRLIAFESDAANLVANDGNGVRDIFVHNIKTGITSRVSVATRGTEGDGPSFHPSLSADGRFVAFESDATTLIDEDTNGKRDVFLHRTR
jgi:Tol biopolymer transport system component